MAPISAAEEERLKHLKVVELKAELAQHGLVQTGKKDELLDRLMEFLNSRSSTAVATGPPSGTSAGEAAPAQQQQQKVEEHPPKITSLVEDEEARRRARAARFGIPVVALDSGKSGNADAPAVSSDHKQHRIERFGVVEPASKKPKTPQVQKPQQPPQQQPKKSVLEGAVDVDLEQLKARQERFGVTVSATLVSKEAQDAKQRRQDRFGGAV